MARIGRSQPIQAHRWPNNGASGVVSLSPAQASIAITVADLPAIGTSNLLSPGTASLPINSTPIAPDVLAGINLSPDAAAITQTGAASAGVGQSFSCAPTATTLTITGAASAGVGSSANMAPTAAALTITPATPSGVGQSTNLAPAAASVTVTASTSSVTTPRNVTPAAASLVLTGASSAIGAAQTISILSSATLTITGATPSGFGAGQTLAPNAASLVITGAAATLQIPLAPAAASIVFTPGQPILPQPSVTLGLRIDVYTAAGVKLGFGPLRALTATYRVALDEIGTFTVDVPADEERASYVSARSQLWFYVGGEGLVFRGIVLRKQKAVAANGTKILRITGASLAYQLADQNTNLGLSFSGTSLSSAIGANATSGSFLYNYGDTSNPVTGWSAGSLDVPSSMLLARYDGQTVWMGITSAAKQFLLHAREDSVTLSGGAPVKKVDVGAFGTSNGIVFRNVEVVSPLLRENTLLYPLSNLQEDEDSSSLVNSVLMVGGGEGVNQLTLRYSTRSIAGGFAYDISNFFGPDGQAQYYIEDATSVATYGRIRKTISVKDAVPLAQSQAGVIAAANALYDVGVQYLQRHKDPVKTYTFDTVGLKHISAGTQLIRPGDKSRLLYHGVAKDIGETANRAWLTVDLNAWIMGFERSFTVDGADAWKLTTASVDALVDDDVSQIAKLYADMYAMKVSLKPYTFRNSYVLTPQSINSTTTATLSVPLDANVTYLHKARLRWRYRALRSNVSTVSAGGSSTPSSSSGGSSSPTSSGGSAHSHTISGSSASNAGSHRHQMFNYVGTGTVTTNSGSSTNTGAPSVASTQDVSNGHTHQVWSVPSSSDGQSTGHTHSLNNHTHISNLQGTYTTYTVKDSGGSNQNFNLLTIGALTLNMYTYETATDHTHTISGSTNSAEASHTHTVTITAHSHTVTIAAHTHSLTYGIYDDASPSGITGTITINGVSRTAAMQAASNPAAPWDSPGTWYTGDITTYLQTTNTEFPLQQTNTITFGAAVLCDVEAVVDIDMTRTALLPV